LQLLKTDTSWLTILTDLAILCRVSGRFSTVSRMQKCDEVNISISIFVELSKKIIALSSLQRIQHKSEDVLKTGAQALTETREIDQD
jgi:hypothetical protein